MEEACGAIARALLHRDTSVISGCPALVSVEVTEVISFCLTQLVGKRMGERRFWMYFKD